MRCRKMSSGKNWRHYWSSFHRNNNVESNLSRWKYVWLRLFHSQFDPQSLYNGNNILYLHQNGIELRIPVKIKWLRDQICDEWVESHKRERSEKCSETSLKSIKNQVYRLFRLSWCVSRLFFNWSIKNIIWALCIVCKQPLKNNQICDKKIQWSGALLEFAPW